MPTETLTNREWLAGEHLSRLECWKAQLVFRYTFSREGGGDAPKECLYSQDLQQGGRLFLPNCAMDSS